MSDNVEVTINDGVKFTGRLIGVINDEERRAIENTEDAARKIFSAQSIDVKDLVGPVGRMFVVATSNYSSDNAREIFISPKIRFTSIRYGQTSWKCEDDNDYKVSQL